MISYETIKSDAVNFRKRLVGDSNGLRMDGHELPVSIKESEFKFISESILNNGLKYGFDVATAFGISSLAMALSIKQNGGKCVTMDAYLEEKAHDCLSYKNEVCTVENSDGFNSVNDIIQKYDLGDTLFPEVGFSPTDTKTSVRKHIQTENLDYILIDALHTTDAFLRDLEAVFELINMEKCLILIHDSHCFDKKIIDGAANRLFGKSVELVKGLEYPHGKGYNMAYISIGDITLPEVN